MLNDCRKREFDSECGSVALEFILMLPIYLLLIGGTMLVFELGMGKLHLQEANRNLAWAGGDRYFTDVSAASKKLNTFIQEYYVRRNMQEYAISGSRDYWMFGDKSNFWAASVTSKKTGEGVFYPDTEWGLMAAGNMELRMNRLSGAFLGMIAVSSVLHPVSADDPPPKVYDKSFVLTRTVVPENEETEADFQPESYLYKRRNSNAERSGSNIEKAYSVISESWPGLDAKGQISTPGTTADQALYERILSKWAQ